MTGNMCGPLRGKAPWNDPDTIVLADGCEGRFFFFCRSHTIVLALFRTTHKVKRQQVVKSRGHHCGDIELAGYLANTGGPVPLVLDLRVTYDRVGSSADPAINGHLCYPNNLDKSLNDTTTDKIRKYRADYNNNPPTVVSFMPAITSTSGRLHNEFIRLLFLQTHRETDRFFADSGVQSV